MNRQLSQKEIDSLIAVVPVKMTKRDKLLHLAQLVRDYEPTTASRDAGWGDHLVIFSNLEYMNCAELSRTHHPYSAFALAAADPKFQAAGLNSDDAWTVMNFLELDQVGLHEFSCDCGGAISNKDMANRIEHLAQR
jgi:hypothetical protein